MDDVGRLRIDLVATHDRLVRECMRLMRDLNAPVCVDAQGLFLAQAEQRLNALAESTKVLGGKAEALARLCR